MPVLGEEQGHKLGMDFVQFAEAAAQILSHQAPVNRRVITGKMYVFQTFAYCLQILFHQTDLSGFPGSVQTFDNNQHNYSSMYTSSPGSAKPKPSRANLSRESREVVKICIWSSRRSLSCFNSSIRRSC